MSHFNLAVLHRDPDGASIIALLAPFDETTNNSDYLTFDGDEEDALDEKAGKRSYYHNENAKYDWYEIGGRWRGLLKLKPGTKGRYAFPSSDPAHPDNLTHCDTAQVKDIDFEPSKEVYKRSLAIWDYVVEGQPWPYKNCKAPSFLYNPEYYKRLYGDRETYAQLMSEFSTYAYLTEDGEWHEPGQMGWFGFSDETRESKLAYREAFQRDVINADPDLFITILDCHI